MGHPPPRAGALALHLLGRADLGARDPVDYADRLARLRAGDLRVLLERVPTAHHAAGPPICSLLQRCRHHSIALEGIALVATDLGERCLPGLEGNDTAPLARAIETALHIQPHLYGQPLLPHVVLSRHLTEAAFRAAVGRWLRRRPRWSRVVVSLAGGPTEGFLGVLMGCLEAGVVPEVCVTNQPEVGLGDLFELRVPQPAERWLVRTGAFDAMAELDAQRRQEWRFLAALARFDWKGAESLRQRARVDVIEAMGLPAAPLGTPPASAAGWAFYRRLIEGVAFRLVSAGEPAGLAAARAWPVLHLREAVARGGEHDSRPGPWKLTKERVEDYVGRWEQGQVAAPDWIEAAAPRHRWRAAHRAARRLAHGQPVERGEALEAVRRLAVATSDPDPLTAALGPLGERPIPLLPGRGWLVLVCAGGPELPLPNASHMLAAVQTRLAGAGADVPAASHLRLLATAEGQALAGWLVERVRGAFRTVEVVGPARVNDPESCRRVVLDHLRAQPELHEAARAVFACNPGSKAMNLGAALAVLEWSFEAMRPFAIVPLARSDAGSELRLEGRLRPVAARLLHDRVLARLLPGLIERLELGLAHELASMGSDRWGAVTRAVHGLRRGWLGRRLDARRWFPARVELCISLARHDSWRALHTFCALADQAWSRLEAGAWSYTWRLGSGLEPCARLWRWRLDGPLGHDFMGSLPPEAGGPEGMSAVMRQAVAALRLAGFVPPDSEPESRLADDLERLLVQVRAVEVLT